MKRRIIALSALVIFVSCDPTSIKMYNYCECHLYGKATTGEIIYRERIDGKDKTTECGNKEKELKAKYDTPNGSVVAQCRIIEDY